MSSLCHRGVRLAFETRGDGPPLLLLMGLGASSAAWAPHLAAYERYFRCILLDNRGAGDSERPAGPYTTRMMAEDALAILDHLGIAQTAVAGISMGSCIAQELALARPDRVSRLVLVSTWAGCDAYTTAVFEHFRQMRLLSTPEEFALLLHLWIFSAGHLNRHMHEMAEQRRGAEADWMPADAFAAQCAACIGHNTVARLAGLRVPALLTVGTQDIFTPQRLTEEVAGLIPDSTVVRFQDCGHAHHWEDLDRFHALTIDFLRHGATQP